MDIYIKSSGYAQVLTFPIRIFGGAEIITNGSVFNSYPYYLAASQPPSIVEMLYRLAGRLGIACEEAKPRRGGHYLRRNMKMNELYI